MKHSIYDTDAWISPLAPLDQSTAIFWDLTRRLERSMKQTRRAELLRERHWAAAQIYAQTDLRTACTIMKRNHATVRQFISSAMIQHMLENRSLEAAK